jgi:hypothetical protein
MPHIQTAQPPHRPTLHRQPPHPHPSATPDPQEPGGLDLPVEPDQGLVLPDIAMDPEGDRMVSPEP